MDEIIASARKEVLIDMVKLAQKKYMAGNQGLWKEFLKVYDKKYGSSLSDPSRRNLDTLEAFLKTFNQEEAVKFFKKVLKCHSNRDKVEEFKKSCPDNETAEQSLVRLTLQHPHYSTEYCFPSHEEEWLIIKYSNKSKIMKSTAMVAIDCEMVLCEDGTEALVKVCVVDRNLQVKLDELVNPNKPVADYRTEITGISAENLVGVNCSLVDVQKSVKKLLSRGTILVGHGVNNDLQALKLDYARVIDTSYIFKYVNMLNSKKPSLSFLCKAVLDYDLRMPGNPHNCLDDACAPMKLVLARLESRTDGVITEEMKKLDLGKLLMHMIPDTIKSEDLRKVLPGELSVQVKITKKFRNTYSAFAMYKNRAEANETFENLEGDLEMDSFGRPQKLVKVKLSSGLMCSIYVCNTASEGSVGDVNGKKRLVGDENLSSTFKKSRTNGTSEQVEDTAKCEEHLEEIERLKQELRERDQEISNLNRIIAALARKQGL